jgi:hypothetical protein
LKKGPRSRSYDPWGLLCNPCDEDEEKMISFFIFPSNGAPVEWNWQGKAEVLGEKPVPVSLCPPQIPRAPTRDLTRSSAVRGRRLTAWAIAQPSETPCCTEESSLCADRGSEWEVDMTPRLVLLNLTIIVLCFVLVYLLSLSGMNERKEVQIKMEMCRKCSPKCMFVVSIHVLLLVEAETGLLLWHRCVTYATLMSNTETPPCHGSGG